MPAIMRIDQAGLSNGEAGFARSDGLHTGALVTLRSVGGGLTHTFTLLHVPLSDGSAVASLVQTVDPAVWTFSPTASVYGSYRILLTIDAGLPSEDSSTRIFAIRTPSAHLRIPALNENADSRASLVNSDGTFIEASEDNEKVTSTPFADGNYSGWWLAHEELFNVVESLSTGGSTPTGPAGGNLAGTYPNPTVAAIKETGGPTSLVIGAIADGQYLVRSGTALTGGTPTATGSAGGQLSGTYPNPNVIGLRETGGPTSLTLGAIPDGYYMVRSGSTVIGQALPPPSKDLAFQAQVTGTTALIIGAVYLATGTLSTNSRALFGVSSTGTATLIMKRFTGGTTMFTLTRAGVVASVALSGTVVISSADWYEFYLSGDVSGTVSVVEGIHLEYV